MTKGNRLWTWWNRIYIKDYDSRVNNQQLNDKWTCVLTFPLRGGNSSHRLRNGLRKLAVDGGISCDNNKWQIHHDLSHRARHCKHALDKLPSQTSGTSCLAFIFNPSQFRICICGINILRKKKKPLSFLIKSLFSVIHIQFTFLFSISKKIIFLFFNFSSFLNIFERK